MNNEIQSATIFYLAARAHSESKKFSQAIRLYTRARESFERCGSSMDAFVGLICLDLSECFLHSGDIEAAERHSQRALSIMRSRAPVYLDGLNAAAGVNESSIVR